MAITIIKNTMVDPIEMTCECCKSVFTYNFQNIQRREERLFFGAGTTIERYVTCPVCKYDNDVDRVIVELQKDKEDDKKNCTNCGHKGEDDICPDCMVTPESGKPTNWIPKNDESEKNSENPDDPCPCHAKHCSSPESCCGCDDYDKWKERQKK